MRVVLLTDSNGNPVSYEKKADEFCTIALTMQRGWRVNCPAYGFVCNRQEQSELVLAVQTKNYQRIAKAIHPVIKKIPSEAKKGLSAQRFVRL